MNPEENQNINSEIKTDELNFQEKQLNTDDNIINQNIINEINPKDNLEIDSDNMTNSDINDSRYMPKGNYPPMDDQNIDIDDNININNINNYIPKNQNKMQIQSQIMNIENDNMIFEQDIEQIQNENNQLQAQIIELKKKLDKKEGLNNQFKSLPNAFNQRFAEYEKRNELLQRNINDLEAQLKNKEIELAESLKDKNKSEIAIKSAGIYKQYMEELQKDFKEKTNKLNQKYIEKESNLKSEYVDEINRKMQKVEELRIENEKLKYDINNFKINRQSLNHQLEEKDFSANSNINQKEKEIQYLKEKINDYEQKSEQKKLIYKENLSEFESQLNEIKQENNELQNELNELRNQQKEKDIKLNNYKHTIQMLNNELNQSKNAINNKASLIEQLGFEIDEMQKALEQKDIDLQNYDLEKQNQINDYNEQIEEIINEQNLIEAQNEEFREYMKKAIESMNQLNEQITEKYGSLEEELGLRINENQMMQKKYKDILKKIKKKQNNLEKKNEELKMKAYNTDFNLGINTQLNKTMQLMHPQNQSFYLDNNINNLVQNENVINNNSNFVNNYYSMYNNIQNIDENNDNDIRQKQTLDDFKQLLRKMDEKLNSHY